MGREHTRSSPWVHRSNPAFPHATLLTVSFVISPVIGLFCHRRLASAQNLTPASRRQNHTTLPSAFSTVRQRCLIASIASRPASVTIASAPRWDETARLGRCFASYRKRDIFAERAGQVICEKCCPARHCERSEAIQLFQQLGSARSVARMSAATCGVAKLQR